MYPGNVLILDRASRPCQEMRATRLALPYAAAAACPGTFPRHSFSQPALRRPDRSPQAERRDLSFPSLLHPSGNGSADNKRSLDKLGMTLPRRPDRSPQAEWRDLSSPSLMHLSSSGSTGNTRSLDKLGMTIARRPDRSPQAERRDLSFPSLLLLSGNGSAGTKRSLGKLGMTIFRRPDRSPQAEWRDLSFQNTRFPAATLSIRSRAFDHRSAAPPANLPGGHP